MNNTIQIDVRDLPCPEPVLKAKKALLGINEHTLKLHNYEIIGNSPRDSNYTKILPRKTPSDYFETSITNALDRSFNTFKRSVTREISSVFRPNSNVFDVSAFDTFLTGLINEVTNVFEVPPSILKSEVPFGRGMNSFQYLSTSSANTDNITIDNNASSSTSTINNNIIFNIWYFIYVVASTWFTIIS